jgi:thymidine kinase
MPLYVTCGPMYSSKTTKLLQQLTVYADSTRLNLSVTFAKPLLINHLEDKKRDSIDGISSHSSQMKGVSPFIDLVYSQHLADVDIGERKVIGIDECQFFDDLFETVNSWLKKGLVVYCAGLNSDAMCRPFGQLHQLLCIATEFHHVTSVCAICLEESLKFGIVGFDLSKSYPASFTLKTGGDPALLVEPGAENIYKPVCQKHHPYFSD